MLGGTLKQNRGHKGKGTIWEKKTPSVLDILSVKRFAEHLIYSELTLLQEGSKGRLHKYTQDKIKNKHMWKTREAQRKVGIKLPQKHMCCKALNFPKSSHKCFLTGSTKATMIRLAISGSKMKKHRLSLNPSLPLQCT